jgi:two-component system cell cycle response regulator DivK
MSRGKVVIFDDDEHLLETSRTLLERAGFEVAVHAGRFDRLGFMLREAPDLVLLDVNMPVIAGDELFALMREQEELRHVPVVFFSSNDETDLRLLVRTSGAQGYIAKSAIGADFGARVARFLTAAPASA